MKKLLILSFAIGLLSCAENRYDNEKHLAAIKVQEDKLQYKTDTIVKIVKDLKEVTEQHTDYQYQMDWLNGEIKHQPNVYTVNKYFVIYTDKSHEEVDNNTWLSYSKGDTITKYVQIVIN